MDLFAGIENAETYGAGNYITPGDFGALEVVEVRKQDGQNGVFIPLDFRVRKFTPTVEVMGVRVPNESGGLKRGTAPAPVWKPGQRATHMINTAHPSWLSNFKSFMLAAIPALADIADAKQWSDACNQAISEDQPLAGCLVSALAIDDNTRGTKLPFVKVSYRPFEGDPASLPALEVADGDS